MRLLKSFEIQRSFFEIRDEVLEELIGEADALEGEGEFEQAKLKRDRIAEISQWYKVPSWMVTYSFARAIKKPGLEMWKGKKENVAAAQMELLKVLLQVRAARLAVLEEFDALLGRKGFTWVFNNLEDLDALLKANATAENLGEMVAKFDEGRADAAQTTDDQALDEAAAVRVLTSEEAVLPADAALLVLDEIDKILGFKERNADLLSDLAEGKIGSKYFTMRFATYFLALAQGLEEVRDSVEGESLALPRLDDLERILNRFLDHRNVMPKGVEIVDRTRYDPSAQGKSHYAADIRLTLFKAGLSYEEQKILSDAVVALKDAISRIKNAITVDLKVADPALTAVAVDTMLQRYPINFKRSESKKHIALVYKVLDLIDSEGILPEVGTEFFLEILLRESEVTPKNESWVRQSIELLLLYDYKVTDKLTNALVSQLTDIDATDPFFVKDLSHYKSPKTRTARIINQFLSAPSGRLRLRDSSGRTASELFSRIIMREIFRGEEWRFFSDKQYIGADWDPKREKIRPEIKRWVDETVDLLEGHNLIKYAEDRSAVEEGLMKIITETPADAAMTMGEAIEFLKSGSWRVLGDGMSSSGELTVTFDEHSNKLILHSSSLSKKKKTKKISTADTTAEDLLDEFGRTIPLTSQSVYQLFAFRTDHIITTEMTMEETIEFFVRSSWHIKVDGVASRYANRLTVTFDERKEELVLEAPTLNMRIPTAGKTVRGLLDEFGKTIPLTSQGVYQLLAVRMKDITGVKMAMQETIEFFAAGSWHIRVDQAKSLFAEMLAVTFDAHNKKLVLTAPTFNMGILTVATTVRGLVDEIGKIIPLTPQSVYQLLTFRMDHTADAALTAVLPNVPEWVQVKSTPMGRKALESQMAEVNGSLTGIKIVALESGYLNVVVTPPEHGQRRFHYGRLFSAVSVDRANGVLFVTVLERSGSGTRLERFDRIEIPKSISSIKRLDSF